MGFNCKDLIFYDSKSFLMMKQPCFDKGWTMDTRVPGDIVGDAMGYCNG